jgi:hypothetical protein
MVPAHEKISGSLLTLVLIVLSEASLASCRGINASLPFTPSIVFSSIPPLNPFVANGTVLHSGTYRYSYSYFPSVRCTSAVGTIEAGGYGTYLGNGIYTTGVAGVGIRQPNFPSTYWSSFVSYNYWQSNTDSFQLIKTGPIPSGGQTSNWGVWTRTHTHRQDLQRAPFPSIRINILTRPTCRLGASTIPVNFGQVPIRLTNGQLAQRTVPLAVQCSGGSSGQSTPVRVTFTDSNATANRSNNLTITPANSGMTINLRYNGSAIFFGPQSSAAGNPGQFQLGTAGNGTYTYNVTAHLMRNAPMRGLPAFSARATMTMRYE